MGGLRLCRSSRDASVVSGVLPGKLCRNIWESALLTMLVDSSMIAHEAPSAKFTRSLAAPSLSPFREVDLFAHRAGHAADGSWSLSTSGTSAQCALGGCIVVGVRRAVKYRPLKRHMRGGEARSLLLPDQEKRARQQRWGEARGESVATL